jgi:Protein of unknown function (DUF2934)
VKHTSDRDGKSKTASAVDQKRHQEQHETKVIENREENSLGYDEIAERAFLIWQSKGCPMGSAEQDWYQAEEELRAITNSRNVTNSTAKSVSVQR